MATRWCGTSAVSGSRGKPRTERRLVADGSDRVAGANRFAPAYRTEPAPAAGGRRDRGGPSRRRRRPDRRRVAPPRGAAARRARLAGRDRHASVARRSESRVHRPGRRALFRHRSERVGLGRRRGDCGRRTRAVGPPPRGRPGRAARPGAVPSALVALRDAARSRGVAFLSDNRSVSLGLGAGSITWPVERLPAPSAVPWSDVRDVPTVLVTGSNGKTTTVRLLAALAAAGGRVPGQTSTDGVVRRSRKATTRDRKAPGSCSAIAASTSPSWRPRGVASCAAALPWSGPRWQW